MIERFIDEARRADASVERIGGFADIPENVAEYLGRSNRFGKDIKLKITPEEALKNVDWQDFGENHLDFGAASPDDDVSIAIAYAGVAETGTLAMVSGPNCPVSCIFWWKPKSSCWLKAPSSDRTKRFGGYYENKTIKC